MEFGDQDLRLVMNRALRSVLIAIVVGIPIIWFAWGWRSALLYVVGGAIAATANMAAATKAVTCLATTSLVIAMTGVAASSRIKRRWANDKSENFGQ